MHFVSLGDCFWGLAFTAFPFLLSPICFTSFIILFPDPRCSIKSYSQSAISELNSHEFDLLRFQRSVTIVCSDRSDLVDYFDTFDHLAESRILSVKMR